MRALDCRSPPWTTLAGRRLPVDGPVADNHLSEYAEAIDTRDCDGAMRIPAEHAMGISKWADDGLPATLLWVGFMDSTPTWMRELADIDAIPVWAEFVELPGRSLLLVGDAS